MASIKNAADLTPEQWNGLIRAWLENGDGCSIGQLLADTVGNNFDPEDVDAIYLANQGSQWKGIIRDGRLGLDSSREE